MPDALKKFKSLFPRTVFCAVSDICKIYSRRIISVKFREQVENISNPKGVWDFRFSSYLLR